MEAPHFCRKVSEGRINSLAGFSVISAPAFLNIKRFSVFWVWHLPRSGAGRTLWVETVHVGDAPGGLLCCQELDLLSWMICKAE